MSIFIIKIVLLLGVHSGGKELLTTGGLEPPVFVFKIISEF